MRLAVATIFLLAGQQAHAQVGEHCRAISNILVRALCFDDAYRQLGPLEHVATSDLTSGAPDDAPRPVSRPARPPQISPPNEPGISMSGVEREAFRLAVGGCWVVSPEAQAAGVTVTVTFELDIEGYIIAGPDLLTSSGGTPSAVEAAFQSARQAITRCGRNGYNLPPEKYEQWRLIEMTFDPSGLRLR